VNNYGWAGYLFSVSAVVWMMMFCWWHVVYRLHQWCNTQW